MSEGEGDIAFETLPHEVLLLIVRNVTDTQDLSALACCNKLLAGVVRVHIESGDVVFTVEEASPTNIAPCHRVRRLLHTYFPATRSDSRTVSVRIFRCMNLWWEEILDILPDTVDVSLRVEECEACSGFFREGAVKWPQRRIVSLSLERCTEKRIPHFKRCIFRFWAEELWNLGSLRSLTVTHMSTNSYWDSLSLEEITIVGNNDRALYFSRRNLPRLRKVTIWGYKLSASVLRHLLRCTTLELLCLVNCTCDNLAQVLLETNVPPGLEVRVAGCDSFDEMLSPMVMVDENLCEVARVARDSVDKWLEQVHEWEACDDKSSVEFVHWRGSDEAHAFNSLQNPKGLMEMFLHRANRVVTHANEEAWVAYVQRCATEMLKRPDVYGVGCRGVFPMLMYVFMRVRTTTLAEQLPVFYPSGRLCNELQALVDIAGHCARGAEHEAWEALEWLVRGGANPFRAEVLVTLLGGNRALWRRHAASDSDSSAQNPFIARLMDVFGRVAAPYVGEQPLKTVQLTDINPHNVAYRLMESVMSTMHVPIYALLMEAGLSMRFWSLCIVVRAYRIYGGSVYLRVIRWLVQHTEVSFEWRANSPYARRGEMKGQPTPTVFHKAVEWDDDSLLRALLSADRAVRAVAEAGLFRYHWRHGLNDEYRQCPVTFAVRFGSWKVLHTLRELCADAPIWEQGLRLMAVNHKTGFRDGQRFREFLESPRA